MSLSCTYSHSVEIICSQAYKIYYFWLIWISIWNWIIFLRFIYSSCWFLWTTCASNIPLCNLATQDLASLHSGKVTSAFFLSTPRHCLEIIFLSFHSKYFSLSTNCISPILSSVFQEHYIRLLSNSSWWYSTRRSLKSLINWSLELKFLFQNPWSMCTGEFVFIQIYVWTQNQSTHQNVVIWHITSFSL